MHVRPISSTFQQTGGICNVANGTGQCQRRCKEVWETVGFARIWICVKDKVFNGLLTLVNNQRGRIEVSGATRIKEEVTHPSWNIIPQDTFVCDLCMDTNQMGVFIDKPPQAVLIWDITDVSYFPEGCGYGYFHSKHKVYRYWAWIRNSLSETFVEEITCFNEKLVKVEWITFPGQVEKIMPPNKLCRHH